MDFVSIWTREKLNFFVLSFIKYMEIWKDIQGNGCYGRKIKDYEVSNKGRIRKNGKLIKPKLNDGYLYIPFIGRIHILVAESFLNHIKSGHKIVVDHIDENKLNNNVNNLQLLSHRDNTNKSIDKTKTTSKYIGVTYTNNKWRSRIGIKGKRIHLGYFLDEYEAHLAYQEALTRLLN